MSSLQAEHSINRQLTRQVLSKEPVAILSLYTRNKLNNPRAAIDCADSPVRVVKCNGVDNIPVSLQREELLSR